MESKWGERLRVPEAKDLKEGDTWYLLSSSWVKELLSESSRDIPLDNSDLLEEDGSSLKPGLSLGKDFVAVNKQTWNDLLETFKLKASQDPIPRTVVGSRLSVYPSDLSRLHEKLKATKNKKLLVDELWYLVDIHWYSSLLTYLEESVKKNDPGPIDNSALLDQEGELRKDISERSDFEYVDKPLWDELVERFSLVEDQEPIERKVVTHGKAISETVIDLHPFNAFLLNDKKEKIKFKCSKYDSRDVLMEKVKKTLDLDLDLDIKIKVEYPSEDGEVISNSNSQYIHKGDDSLDGFSLANGCLLTVKEDSKENGERTKASTSNTVSTKPGKIRNKYSSKDILSSNSDDPKKESSESSYSSLPTRYNTSLYFEGHEDANAKPGICGLSNLGNTCFMNSIIQGLSNTPPITEYFANDNYIEDINTTNPLGMKGEIAKTFGEMIKLMWSGQNKYVTPLSFKSAVGRFAPQFSGYQQQDSQELLTFLLDGLHEDLNRVKKKPYIEIKDSGDRPDEEVALEAWEVYKKRNDSVILDVFHGLLKSTLICPVCPKVSVTFDPFCYLSLPLPDHREIQMKVRVVWYDKSRQATLYKLTVPKAGTFSDLLKVLSKETRVPKEHFKMTEIFSNKISKEYKLEHPLAQIHDDTFAYELPPLSEETTYSTISFREKPPEGAAKLFHPPVIMRVGRGISGENLYDEIISHLDPLLKKPDPEELPSKSNNEDSNASSAKTTTLGLNSSNNNNEESTTSAGREESPVLQEEEEEVVGNEEVEDNNVENEDSSLASEDVKMNLGEDEESLSNCGRSTIFKLCSLAINCSIVDRYIDLSEDNLFSKGNLNIGLEFTPENKKLYFNDKFATKIEYDLSVSRVHQKTPIKLSDCLELYTTNEKLGKDDAWYCPNCAEHQQATKKFDLWSLPSILVISLKRFSYTRSWRDKLDTLVDFPINGLDMSPYIINSKHDPAIYDLIAVSNHYGVMGGGHYTAMAKNKNDGKWYNFDDASVHQKKESDVVTNAAYVLFYQRRESRSKPSSTVTSNSYQHITNGGGKNGSLSSSFSGGEEEEKMDVN